MPRPRSPMTAKIENCIRADARGEPHDKIMEEFLGITKDSTPQERNKAEQQLYRWRHRPDADAIWQDELRAVVRRHVPCSIGKIRSQIESNTDWLANKAANDVITLASRIGVIRTEETAMKVEISGMPDLGSPDQEE